MFRFIVTCLTLAAVIVVSVVLLGRMTWDQGYANQPSRPGTPDQPGAPLAEKVEQERPRTSIDADQAVSVKETAATGGAVAPLVIQDARVLPVERQDVPSERDGKLVLLARPARPGERIPADKRLEREVAELAVEVSSWDGVKEEERLRDSAYPRKFYRRARPTDELAPGTTAIIRHTMVFRKLEVGDVVEEGQLLGVVNPALSMEELAIKQSKVEGAQAEVRASMALLEESKRRLDSMKTLRAKGGRYLVTEDDYGIALATEQRYVQEVVSKRAAVRQAQRELSAAQTTLSMHLLRAMIPGVIKVIHRQQGEAVKNLEPVLQIQNPDMLRVEAQLEVQDAVPLRDRLKQADWNRRKADELHAKALARGETAEPADARRLREQADALVRVEVDVSRLEPPRAALTGHLHEVTCVAVAQVRVDADGKVRRPVLVSGSEDHTVRVWSKKATDDKYRYQEEVELNHHAVVRAVACTGSGAARDLLLTGTAAGTARLFDLANLKTSERRLSERHSGGVNVVAFSADGELCATGGEDRAICVYRTKSGQLLAKVTNAHQQAVTSLAFTPRMQLVSAGRDRRLVVWDVTEEGAKLTRAGVFDRRSNDVPVLGVDRSGDHVLFDEGREMRVLSLKTRKMEGALANPAGSANFSTMALYSPDGHTILTNGNAAGRLQLWRTPSAKTRPAELRNWVWSSGTVNCGAFDPLGAFAVTGTSDGRVLVWEMPSQKEAQTVLPGQLNYVEEFLDTSLKRVAVRATLKNPGWVIPGGHATLVVLPRPR